jgi:membrane glycosyltransferase
MALSAAAHAHAHHTLAGVVMALAALMIAPSLFLWMLPVWLGLMLSIPLAQATSTVTAGDMTRKLGLFLIPEERAEDLAARDQAAAKTAPAVS